MVKFKIEYEITPIRFIEVQCPECSEWQNARDISREHIHDRVDAEYANYSCKHCWREFCPKEDGMEVVEEK